MSENCCGLRFWREEKTLGFRWTCDEERFSIILLLANKAFMGLIIMVARAGRERS